MKQKLLYIIPFMDKESLVPSSERKLKGHVEFVRLAHESLIPNRCPSLRKPQEDQARVLKHKNRMVSCQSATIVRISFSVLFR